MPLYRLGSPALPHRVDPPCQEIDWEFVDAVVDACNNVRDPTTYGGTIHLSTARGHSLMFTPSQLFITWLGSEGRTPEDAAAGGVEADGYIERLVRAVRGHTLRLLDQYDIDMVHRTPQFAAAEYAVIRAIYAQMAPKVEGGLCFISLLRREWVKSDDCSCHKCPTCNVHHTTDTQEHCHSCDNCLACCTCYACSDCGSRVAALACSDCESCHDCECSCLRCLECSARHDRVDLCRDCDNCDSCCFCEDGFNDGGANKLRRRTEALVKFEAVKGKQSRNTLRRLLGAEIEISKGREATNIRNVLGMWKASVVNDGSLPSSGSEIVTQPAAGDRWVEMVDAITRELHTPKVGGAVDSHCGLHIHVDAGDMNVWDVKRFIKLYAHVEQAMFDLTDADKERCSRYAQPCGRSFTKMLDGMGGKGMKQLFLQKHYNQRLPRVGDWIYNPVTRREEVATPDTLTKLANTRTMETITHKYHDTRYRAVNLHSYFFRGTIEFRHHHGTIDGETIIGWGIVCGSLVEWASRHTDQELLKLCVGGRSRKKVLEMTVDQPAVIRWMRSRWDREGERVSVEDILKHGGIRED